ncbi:hypothetical protein AGMMS50293_10550 [Spirochaetia bacterium]|nr:hypothetical protein AGMMS50293_10550 [Spirochaetia bacterium]
MKPGRFVFVLLIAGFVLRSGSLAAADFSEGRMRLSIHENTGRFSLYYLSDVSEQHYEPLFTAQDPRTSFIAININDRIYRLGESSAFRIIADEHQPLLVFESPFLTVQESFSFIKTAGSTETNGVKITIRIENTAALQASIGMRFLLDTSLGEGAVRIPFVTEKQNIVSETIIDRASFEKNWVSRNDQVSLMGSFSGAGDREPDFLHFANWKRLNDVPWEAGYSRGRSFSFPPYSIGDSAVCYYYEPAPLPSGKFFTCSVFLATEDPAGFDLGRAISTTGLDADLALMRELLERLDRYLSGQIQISEEELAAIEQSITRIKARRGFRP